MGHWEHGLYADRMEEIRKAFVIRHSAVVLSELRRGARTRESQRLVHALHEAAWENWIPMARDWWEAGRLVQRIGDAQNWETSKRREFQNDALIALTARSHGAMIVTANRADFTLLSRE